LNMVAAIITLAAIGFKSQAQVAALPFTASLDSFYEITGTTVDALYADDVVYQNIPIGFDFYLGGTLHDKMSINTNGYIELDSTGTSTFINIMNGSQNNLVAPFAADLQNKSSNASLQYLTVGTAPNRVCYIQWLHYSYFAGQGDINFQIRLYESSNCISFVYGANTLVQNPLQTQIGLRGTTNLDFVVLGDTSCNWASAYPYPTITTYFPVSFSCNMPSGFAFNFGSCINKGTANFGFITGKVFDDTNGNGTLDSAEAGIKNQLVNITPGNYYVSTNATGSYSFFFVDSTITYSLTVAPITYWNQTNIPNVITCQPSTQACSGLNFGFQIIPNIHEVEIHCPNWGAKPLQPEPMPIWYVNNGTATESDTITFEMDSLYSFISAIPAPTSVNGQTIKWAYSNLMPNQSGSIMLHLLPSGQAVLGNYLDSKLSIAPLNDTIPTNNIINLHQLITNSWDPNDKLAEPSGMIKAGTEIDYTIHFQNTGNAAADNVVLKDTLDSNLDLMSFKLIGASHNVNFAMEGNGIATFTFYNIQLPDSGTDMAGSNGYVSYKVKTKQGLAPLTVINNTAGIYFDFNPAIITNMTADTIEIPLGIITTTEKVFVIHASPNPSVGNIVFAFSKNINEQANLTITDANGKIILQQNNITSTQNIDLKNLAAGIYIATISSQRGTETVKIVKE
ncbi:MAG TPA: T9SS type A sorting domain-containing protein, partial [Bacteroidia bacterium]|nr:T9SS type A sorting domain-containing protein [Bacteroidia bacterium]